MGYTLIFLFLLKIFIVGTRYNRLGGAVLTSTHNLCFEQKYENIRIFHRKVFIFGGKILNIF